MKRATRRDPRAALVTACRELAAAGLNRGATGNLSVRTEQGLLITPSGVPARALRPAQMVPIGADGRPADKAWRPSSEWRLHRALYRAHPEIGAVVHAHPPHATALACAHRPIPAFHYMVALAGGHGIPLAPYATFGTEALSEVVVDTLRECRACLLANHGMVAMGADLEATCRLAEEVEHLARVYLLTLQAGNPQILDDTEMTRVSEKFTSYGRQPR